MLVLVAVRVGASDGEVQRLLELGDGAWERRAEGARGTVAAPGPIGEAVDAYARAIELAPDRTDLRVRLLRALFFQGEYATADQAAKKRIFDRGRKVFEESANRLARRLGAPRGDDIDVAAMARSLASEPEAGALHYWGAVHWGLWGEHFGNVAAVKKGVAKKVRDHGELARLLAPDYDGGAPYRLLGRLHAVAPRVPLFTMWIDHDRGIEYLEQAHGLVADNPLHDVFLGEALLDHGPASARARGMALLQHAAAAVPRPGFEVEDASAIADAKESLAGRRRAQR